MQWCWRHTNNSSLVFFFYVEAPSRVEPMLVSTSVYPMQYRAARSTSIPVSRISNAMQRGGFIKTSEMRCPDLQSPSPIHLGSSVTIVKQRKCVVVAGVELQLSDHKLLVRSLVFGNTEQQMLYSRNPESAAWSSQSLKSAIELRKGG